MKRELTKSWEKDGHCEQVMYLFKDTFASRRIEMKGYVGRPMFKLCSNYPMLKDGNYVSIYRCFKVLKTCLMFKSFFLIRNTCLFILKYKLN